MIAPLAVDRLTGLPAVKIGRRNVGFFVSEHHSASPKFSMYVPPYYPPNLVLKTKATLQYAYKSCSSCAAKNKLQMREKSTTTNKAIASHTEFDPNAP